MNLPSIKLNIFKKLEYFLVLKKLNDQFDAQFKILLISKNEKGKYTGNFPTWECEKKILFWTYGFHKHLGSPILADDFLNREEWYRKETLKHYGEYEPKITEYRSKSEKDIKEEIAQVFEDYYKKHQVNTAVKPKDIEKKPSDRLEDIFLSQNEIMNAGIEEVLKNLVQRGFAEEKEKGEFIISKEGLSFGELLWYLYMPKLDKEYGDVFGNCPRNIKRKNENDLFKLKKNLFSLWIMKFQLWSFYGFTLIAGLFISLEIINTVGLLNNLQADSAKYFNKYFVIFLLLFPFFLFLISFFVDIFYNSWLKNKKYKSILTLIKDE